MCPGNDTIAQSDLLAAVEQAANGIVITDIDGKIRYVNPAFTAMTGYTREEAAGQNPRLLKSGRQPAEIYATALEHDPIRARSGTVSWSTGARMEPSISRKCGSLRYATRMAKSPAISPSSRTSPNAAQPRRQKSARGGCGKLRERDHRLGSGADHPLLEPRRGSNFWIFRRRRDREAGVDARCHQNG